MSSFPTAVAHNSIREVSQGASRSFKFSHGDLVSGAPHRGKAWECKRAPPRSAHRTDTHHLWESLKLQEASSDHSRTES